jgi:hypothetical protein
MGPEVRLFVSREDNIIEWIKQKYD